MEIWTIQKGSKHSKAIRSILMEILTIRKIFEAFECKFEPFKRYSKHSIANSNHSKGIRSVEMQILAIRKGFEEFKIQFDQFKRDS